MRLVLLHEASEPSGRHRSSPLSCRRQEYGISQAEKLDIAQAYCVPLMKKIQLDLQRTHEDEAVNKLHPL